MADRPGLGTCTVKTWGNLSSLLSWWVAFALCGSSSAVLPGLCLPSSMLLHPSTLPRSGTTHLLTTTLASEQMRKLDTARDHQRDHQRGWKLGLDCDLIKKYIEWLGI